MEKIIDKIIKELTTSRFVTLFFVFVFYFTAHTNKDQFKAISLLLVKSIFNNKSNIDFINILMSNVIIFGLAMYLFLHGLYYLLYNYDEEKNCIERESYFPIVALKNGYRLFYSLYYFFSFKFLILSIAYYDLSVNDFIYKFTDGLSNNYFWCCLCLFPYFISYIKEKMS